VNQAAANIFRERLAQEKFVVTIEYCLGRRDEPLDDLWAIAEMACEDDRIAAIALTDRVTSVEDYSPLEVAPEVASRSGKVPLVHLAGKCRTVDDLADCLQRCESLGLQNILIVTGDVPKDAGGTPMRERRFDFLDSVQGVDLANRWSREFLIGAGVSTFKYTEPEVMGQYMKMHKKLARGATVIFNQVGLDLRKTEELRRWLEFTGRQQVRTIAALYWLTPGFARYAKAGNVPGVIFTDDALSRLVEISKEPDKGVGRRTEMLAVQIALCRLFGYSGVHIGGFKKPASIKRVLDRYEQILADGPGLSELWSRWQELWRLADGRVAELGISDGFYLFRPDEADLNSSEPVQVPPPRLPSIRRTLMAATHEMFFSDDTRMGRLAMRTWRLFDRVPGGAKALYWFERAVKIPIFGCEGCGSCSLPETEYICTEHDCGKALPNGPCGGSDERHCEVFPKRTCAWVKIYDRAKASGTWDELHEQFVPAKDRALKGTCSWVNLATGRDHRSVQVVERLLRQRRAEQVAVQG